MWWLDDFFWKGIQQLFHLLFYNYPYQYPVLCKYKQYRVHANSYLSTNWMICPSQPLHALLKRVTTTLKSSDGTEDLLVINTPG